MSASLVKFRCRMLNITLPWKTPKPKFVAFFLLIGMAFSFISSRSNFPKTCHHVVNVVCSHASQKYPRIFLDREPRARNILGYFLTENQSECAKNAIYWSVWYMLMVDIHLLLTNQSARKVTFI